ncbi:MAG: formate dehydrogenase subunit gamma [Pseudotabrizicola sp.]|uniref:formate dehydrogenase subunit gamma n=1 Tax=Pseudotabrizicola sp. TaxID=2939647 RepID=UPI0027185106|nr:formate dehydrogenase subunit gamma [Pseudotabrizicola sp.]MDO9639825.1 formate dehydrogenase subunit gamma [Pseudotabrizicola sp.]
MPDDHAILTRTAEIVQAHQGVEGALLPMLHAVQAEFGHVPQAAMPALAAGAGVTRAELHGVVSFYHDFREVPAGATVVRLCRAEACQAMGGDQLAAQVQAQLGLGWHDTSADGAVTLEPVFCLGLCACAPAAQVAGRLIGRADAARVVAAVAGGQA